LVDSEREVLEIQVGIIFEVRERFKHLEHDDVELLTGMSSLQLHSVNMILMSCKSALILW
jgi:hypothetical protein